MKRVLLACEESQIVTIEMRKLGLEAYSCDLMECSGGHPEWHLQQDVIPLLEEEWDMIIAFPPCTHLSPVGAAFFEQKRKDGRQQQGIDFFMNFALCDCERVGIENPIGIMSTGWKKPTQIIQPYWFGDFAQKATCLWLKGLPLLRGTKLVDKGEMTIRKSGKTKGKREPTWFRDAKYIDGSASLARSKTFPGIAKAMADQWGRLLLDDKKPVQEGFFPLFR